jgi:hypothetical protein
LAHARLFCSDDRLPYGIIDVTKSPKTFLSAPREIITFSVTSIKLICVSMQMNILLDGNKKCVLGQVPFHVFHIYAVLQS